MHFPNLQQYPFYAAFPPTFDQVEKEELKIKFENEGFLTIAEQLGTIGQFESSAKMREEFYSRRPLYLKLIKADKDLKKFAEKMKDWLFKNDDVKSYEVFCSLNEDASFMHKKDALKEPQDIQTYIDNVYAFIKKHSR